jgi:TatD DNase family protein
LNCPIFKENQALQFIDLHTHHPCGEPDVLEIESIYPGQYLKGKTRWFSAGLHPWHLGNIGLKEAAGWLRGHAANPGCLAIGEAGLDKVTDTPWALQESAFEQCIRIAVETRKPMIIHCVKAYAEVTAALLNASPVPVAIFHGFDKHPQTAKMLLDAGFFLSFGAALFRQNSHAAAALQQTPSDRFFLETDDNDLDIRSVYERVAAIRQIPPVQLEEQIRQNFTRLGLDITG